MKNIKVKIAAVALLINLNVFANNSDNEKQNCQLLDDIARLNATHIQNPKDEDNNAEFLEKLLEAQLHPSCELTTEQKDIIVETYNSFLAAPNKEFNKDLLPLLGVGTVGVLATTTLFIALAFTPNNYKFYLKNGNISRKKGTLLNLFVTFFTNKICRTR